MPAKMRITKIATSTGITMAAKWVPFGAEIYVSRLEFIITCETVVVRIYKITNLRLN